MRQRTERAWLRALTDRPVGIQIALTVVLTTMCLLVPGLLAFAQFDASVRDVTIRQKSDEIHLAAMRAMDAAVDRFLEHLAGYFIPRRDRYPAAGDEFFTALREVGTSARKYQGSHFTLHHREMWAFAEFEEVYKECRTRFGTGASLDYFDGPEDASARAEMMELAHDLRRTTDELSDATTRAVADWNETTRQRHTSAKLKIVGTAAVGLTLQAGLIVAVVAIRRRGAHPSPLPDGNEPADRQPPNGAR